MLLPYKLPVPWVEVGETAFIDRLAPITEPLTYNAFFYEENLPITSPLFGYKYFTTGLKDAVVDITNECDEICAALDGRYEKYRYDFKSEHGLFPNGLANALVSALSYGADPSSMISIRNTLLMSLLNKAIDDPDSLESETLNIIGFSLAEEDLDSCEEANDFDLAALAQDALSVLASEHNALRRQMGADKFDIVQNESSIQKNKY